MENKLWIGLAVIACLVLALGVVLVQSNAKLSVEDVDSKLDAQELKLTAEAEQIKNIAIDEVNAKSKEAIDIANEATKIAEDKVIEIDTELIDVKTELDEVKAQLEPLLLEQEEITELEGRARYEVDGNELGDEVVFDLSDRQLSSLFDDEIDFDGEEYDAKETVLFDMLLAMNKEDYNENTYLELRKDSFVYLLTFYDNFENDRNLSIDETVTFSLLGDEVELSEWDGTSITFTKGNTHTIEEGTVLEVEGKTVTLLIVNDDFVFVLVAEGDEAESKKIYEGTTREVLGLDIYVDAVMSDEDITDLATLKIGSEVEVEIKTNDDYSDAELWKWVITENSIGLTLNEKFTDLDDEYKPLAYGEQLCLPNNYVCAEFTGLTDESMESFSFEYDEDDKLIEATGNFVIGDESYDEIYFNGTTVFYGEDENGELIEVANTVTIKLEDTEMFLYTDIAVVPGNFAFGIGVDSENLEVEVRNKIQMISVDDMLVGNEDEDFRSVYGMIISSPEDAIDDQEISIEIPEERLEAIVTVYGQ